VTLHDNRTIVGTFLAFDKHLNLVLSEAEEFRTIKSKGGAGLLEERTEKRSLGLVLIRGENVVNLAVDGPPPPSATGKLTPGGPGMARGAGRGMIPPTQGGGGISTPHHPSGGPAMGLGAGPIHGLGAGVGFTPMPPPGGMGMPPPGMGRGMPPPY
jgi:small nuclear ribonucleoprotein B and B'